MLSLPLSLLSVSVIFTSIMTPCVAGEVDAAGAAGAAEAAAVVAVIAREVGAATAPCVAGGVDATGALEAAVAAAVAAREADAAALCCCAQLWCIKQV